MNRRGRIHTGSCERGVSLVEMMVALLIGTLVIGAAVALYLSVMHAMQGARQLNDAQQGLRYVQRMVDERLQRAEAIDGQSRDRMLVLSQPGAPVKSSAAVDCAGHAHADSAGWVESIALTDDGRLTCRGAVLLDGVADFSLRFGRDVDGNHYLQESEYRPADALAGSDWAEVVAVRLELALADDRFQGVPRQHVLYFTRHRKAWQMARTAGESP